LSWFVKTETFNPAFRALAAAERRVHLQAHKTWVSSLRAQGQPMASGFLIDEQQRPGGGGLLVLQAASYAQALALIQQDPLIAGGWVDWQLQEWVPAAGDLSIAS
jgi:uncharacterized protein YciI